MILKLVLHHKRLFSRLAPGLSFCYDKQNKFALFPVNVVDAEKKAENIQRLCLNWHSIVLNVFALLH